MTLDITGEYRYPPPNDAWLARRIEPIIDPDLPIIDAHHHLWEQHGQPYLLPELARDAGSGHAIVATICVEARFRHRTSGPAALAAVGETEAIEGLLAEQDPASTRTKFCAGFVGHADLTLGDGIDAVVAAHLEIAGSRLKGVRHSVARDPHFPNGVVIRPAPEGLLGDAAYRRGLKQLSVHDLSYDAMLYHSQIPELAAMAAALPDLPIVLDHYGCILGVGPYADRVRENFLDWRRDMAALAERPNVRVKLGGMGMIVCGARFHEREEPPGSEELAALWSPYIRTTIDLFGPDRCMFESNFPVDKAMMSYAVLWNAFKRATADLAVAERHALFHDTAKEFYRL